MGTGLKGLSPKRTSARVPTLAVASASQETGDGLGGNEYPASAQRQRLLLRSQAGCRAATINLPINLYP